MNRWLALTRPGYETEFTREFKGKIISAKPGSGVVVAESDAEAARKPWKALDPRRFVFARQIFMLIGEAGESGAPDAATRIASVALEWRKKERLAVGFHSLMVEAPDTQAGKMALQRAGELDSEVAERLRDVGLVPRRRGGLPRLHVFIDEGGKLLLGLSDPVLGTPWPMGAPRFELPPEAPSRSARKLQEALMVFIPDSERFDRVGAGMRAVDLGASPGGWSWLLAGRGLMVEAVDNGPMSPEVFSLGLVTHVKADGYSYRPERAVDWLFCDIVGGALRIARLVANWVGRGHFREAIFNLKLGEGDRFGQFEQARRLVTGVARDSGVTLEFRARQLYHDRDEVTAHIRIISREEPKPKAGPRKTEKDKGGATSGARRGGAGPGKKVGGEGKSAPKKIEKGKGGATSGSRRGGAGPGKKVGGEGKSAPKKIEKGKGGATSGARRGGAGTGKKVEGEGKSGRPGTVSRPSGGKAVRKGQKGRAGGRP